MDATRLARRCSLATIVVFVLLCAFAGIARAGGGHGGGNGGSGGNPHSKDTTPPTVAISSPAGGATASGKVTIAGSASDNVSVAGVAVSIDGSGWRSASGMTGWSYALDTTTLANGAHTVAAQATDTAGNKASVSETINVSNSSPSPTVTIAAPTAGATLAGSVTVSGGAADTVALAKVELAVDGGSYQAAQGTSSWSYPLDTTKLANGSHALAVRVTDTAGATASASVPVSVSNTVADTSPPKVAISAPAVGATVSGSVTVSGTAADNVALAEVELSVDGGAYQLASGTGSWSFGLSTTALANSSHTLTARATDTSGNAQTASVTITVSNTASTSPTVVDQLLTPEGATIQIYSDAVGWTAQQIYDLLKPNAYQLNLIGPTLTVKVSAQWMSSTPTSVAERDGVYYDYNATMYLQANGGSTFATIPDDVIAHEYGHAWSLYHYYLDEHASWTRYLQARGLASDSRAGSGPYMWQPAEIIAEDYRLLFGTQAAQSQTAQMNYLLPDARAIPGLKDFLATAW